MNVLVGANGSGKSNFINALELLGRIVDEQLQRSRRERGGASLLHEPKTRRIELGVASLKNRHHATLEATQDDPILLLINDHPDTAPSRRLQERLPPYRKTLHGPLCVESLGLSALRTRCPHLDGWLAGLERLAR